MSSGSGPEAAVTSPPPAIDRVVVATPSAAASPVAPVAPTDSAADLRRTAVLICSGVFVTTLATHHQILKLPIEALLKDELHLGQTQMAAFMAAAGLAWYLKPLAGIFSDSVPLFGTRRRHYLLISSVMAALFWVLAGNVRHDFTPILIAVVLANVMVMFGSTVIGGLLVDQSRLLSATGRLSALRLAVMNTAALVAGPVGGWLAGKTFRVSTAATAGLMVAFTLVAARLAREERIDSWREGALRQTWAQFNSLFRSGPLWAAVGLTFLFYVAPGFSTPLYFYQRDQLHFSSGDIGVLGAVGAACSIAGALCYGLVCRRFGLRTLLAMGIGLCACSNLLYLGYVSWQAAIVVEASNGFFFSLGLIPLYDLAARSTPRGSEAMGYSLVMALGNLSISLSNMFGSWLSDAQHVPFLRLVWINAATTALVLIVVPYLPRVILTRRDGEAAPADVDSNP